MVMKRRPVTLAESGEALCAVASSPEKPPPMVPVLVSRDVEAGNYVLLTKGPTGSGHITTAKGHIGLYKPAMLPDVLGRYLKFLLPGVREKSWVASFFLGLFVPLFTAVFSEGRSAAMRMRKEASRSRLPPSRRHQASLPSKVIGSTRPSTRLAAMHLHHARSLKARRKSKARLEARQREPPRRHLSQGHGQGRAPAARLLQKKAALRLRLKLGWNVN